MLCIEHCKLVNGLIDRVKRCYFAVKLQSAHTKSIFTQLDFYSIIGQNHILLMILPVHSARFANFFVTKISTIHTNLREELHVPVHVQLSRLVADMVNPQMVRCEPSHELCDLDLTSEDEI